MIDKTKLTIQLIALAILIIASIVSVWIFKTTDWAVGPESDSNETNLGSSLPTPAAIIEHAAERNGCFGDDFLILLAIRKAENGRGIERQKILDIERNWIYILNQKEIKIWKQKYAQNVKNENVLILSTKEKHNAKVASGKQHGNGITKLVMLVFPKEGSIIKSIESTFSTKKLNTINPIKNTTKPSADNIEKTIQKKLVKLKKKDISEIKPHFLFGLSGSEKENVSDADTIRTLLYCNGIIETLKTKSFELATHGLESHPKIIKTWLQRLPNATCYVLIAIPKSIINEIITRKCSSMEHYQICWSNDSNVMELSFCKDHGKQFGVKGKAWGTDLETQAAWAASTIVKTRMRWLRAGCPGDWISFLAKRYCPLDSKTWERNVRFWFRRLKCEL